MDIYDFNALFVFIFWSYTHDTFDCINSSKYVILVEKCVNLKLKWMKNYDTKKNNKKSLITCAV